MKKLVYPREWKFVILAGIGFVLLSLLVGCNALESPEKVLNEAKNQLSKAGVVAYKASNEVNNKFNDTEYADSATVVFSKIENSIFGFGLYALWGEAEYVFDGNEFEKVDHSKKVRVTYDNAEIKEDSNYFEGFPFFSTNPFMIEDVNDTGFLMDTLIDGQQHYIYKTELRNASKVDTTETVIYEKFFFVETRSKQVSAIKNLIIRNGDTLQISDYYFTVYAFNQEAEPAPEILELDQEYTVLKAEDETFTYTPIAAGDILSRKRYETVEGKELDIFGNKGKSTVIMFSFIGCTPCEKALLDFKQAEYKFTDSVDLYYSSFQNEAPALKKYLQKKEFPYPAFAKESNMIEAFSLYHSPSFVLIDATGEVMEVIEGYDEEVRDTLFQWLAEK